MEISLTAELMQVTTTRDGGFKIVLTCGTDSIEAINQLIKLHVKGDTLYGVAMVAINSNPHENENVAELNDLVL